MGEKLVEQLLDSEWKARRKKRGRESFRYYRYRNMAWSGWALFDRVGADRVCDHKAGMNGWLARIATIVSDRKSGQRGSLGLRQQTSLSTVRLSCRLVPFQLHSCLLHLLVQACRQRPPAWHSHRIFDYLLDSARSCLAPTFFHSNSPRPRNRWSVCHWIAPPSLIPPFAKRANLLNNLRSIFILHYPHRRTHRQYTIFRRGKFIDLLRSRAYPFVSFSPSVALYRSVTLFFPLDPFPKRCDCESITRRYETTTRVRIGNPLNRRYRSTHVRSTSYDYDEVV